MSFPGNVSFSSLRASPNVMDDVQPKKRRLRQRYAIAYRTRVSQPCSNLFKKDVIYAECEFALDSIEEEQNFLQYIDAGAWLKDILNVRNTFLDTTPFRKEIRINIRNDNDALDSLLGSLPGEYPVPSLSLHIAKHNSFTGAESHTSTTIEQFCKIFSKM